MVETVQDAFQRAVAYAREVLGDKNFTLEEVERNEYRGHEVWLITLGFPKRWLPKSVEENIGGALREYKTFFINAQTGEPMAMKIRELTAGWRAFGKTRNPMES
jgi:hypothetical protein